MSMATTYDISKRVPEDIMKIKLETLHWDQDNNALVFEVEGGGKVKMYVRDSSFSPNKEL